MSNPQEPAKFRSQQPVTLTKQRSKKQKNDDDYSDLKCIGFGIFALIGAFIIPTEKVSCIKDPSIYDNIQSFCTKTIYTYDGVNASTVKTVVFIVATICILGGGYFFVRRLSNRNE